VSVVLGFVIYIYIYICVCVCVCVCDIDNRSIHYRVKNGYCFLPSNPAVGLNVDANNETKPTYMVSYQKQAMTKHEIPALDRRNGKGSGTS